MKRYKKTIHDLLEKVSNGTAKNTTIATNRAYALSNELINETHKKFSVTGKRIAVVGSSGDHALNAIYENCEDITLIDGNIYTKAFTEYKIALIKTFNYKDFIDIFFGHKMFEPAIYAKISHLLPLDIRPFWDEIMLEISSGKDETNELNPRSLEKTMLQGLMRNQRVGNCDFYYNEYDYKCLQRKLLENKFKLKYITADFNQFPDKLKGEFDLIELSNIYDYVPALDYRKVVVKLFDNNLKKGGYIHLEYDLNRQLDDEADKRFSFTIRGQKIKHIVLETEDNYNIDTLYYIQKPNDYIPQQLEL